MCKKLILCTITIIAIVLAMFLPGLFINRQVNGALSTCIEAPAEYYDASSSAIAKEMSTRLTVLEKLELISGNWSSETTITDISTTDFSEWEEIQIAKENFSNLLSGEHLSDAIEFDTWYSYETVMYKCTDTTFNTYSAYFFGITFTKYDKSEKYQLLMSDNGAIIYASNSIITDEFISNENNVTTDDIVENNTQETGIVSDNHTDLIYNKYIELVNNEKNSNHSIKAETIDDIPSKITTNEKGYFTYVLIP